MKRFLFPVLIMMMVCSLPLAQQIYDEDTEDTTEKTETTSPFVLFFNAGGFSTSDSGDFIDYINSVSDRSSSRYGFLLGMEGMYLINDNITASLFISYTFPSSSTFNFTGYPNTNATDKFSSSNFIGYINYRLYSPSGNYPFFSAGAIYSKANYYYTGAYVTQSHELIAENDDEACLSGFGFSVRAGYYLQNFKFHATYNNVSYTMNESCFVGYARDYNTSTVTVNVALKVF